MSTMLANPVEMIRRGAPRLIRNDEQLAEYTRALFDLTAKASPTPEEEEAIELLTLLVERYEQEHFPVPQAQPADVLRYLLERNGLSQRDIVPELGSESTVSLVLSGKRKLNRDHIAALSWRFHVSPAVFFGETLPLHEAIRIVLMGRESRMASTREISDEIERRGLYTRKDGDAARAKQINARVRRYPHLFQVDNEGAVKLLGESAANPQSDKAA
jgi:HTH-type transcriptional regulator / antitoxin HigA